MKFVWKTTPKAAYEWIEVEGGESMSHHEIAAARDSFIEENGLVPVEHDFVGETPVNKYGRYKASSATASALAPTALPTREEDLQKANSELDNLKKENARLLAQLDKKQAKSGADVVEASDTETIGSSGRQTTEDARDTLNQQDGVNIAASGQEERENMDTDDRSDDNPVKRGPGRPPKDSN